MLLLALLALLVSAMPGGVAGQSSTPSSSPASTPTPQTGPQFVLRPADDVDGAYFTLEAEAGSTQTLKAVLGNADDQPLELRTFAADAFTLINGGFGTYEESEESSGTATWIDYEAESLTLEPGEGIEREFTVTVPQDAAPGQYIAGIVLQTAEAEQIEGSAMFDQIVRKSIAVFITVPGETMPSFELGAPEIVSGVAGQRIVVPVSNTGNVLVKPSGELSLTDADGNQAFTQQIAMGSVYAGTETTLELPLPAAIPEGTFSLALTLTDAATSAQAQVADTDVTLSRDAQAETPLEFTAVEVAPRPAEDDVQFAAVSVTVTNRAGAVDGVEVVLNVFRDGEPVEDFVLANAVTLQQGDTTIEQRYIPMDGWTDGTWTFTLTLNATDPQTGAQAALLSTEVGQPIVAGDSQ